MNARAVKKRLMRNRRKVFWGSRALLTVTVPADLLPPCPEPPRVDMSRVLCTYELAPSTRRPDDHSAKCGQSWVYADVDLDVSREDLDTLAEWLEACRQVECPRDEEYNRWPAIEWLHSFWQRSIIADFRDGRWRITYGVKWFYATHKLRFCADIARCLRRWPQIRVEKGEA